MVVIILTEQGLAEMAGNLTEGTHVWLNPALADSKVQPDWQARGLTVQLLPVQFDAHKDKSLIDALDYVEKHSDDADILIECP